MGTTTFRLQAYSPSVGECMICNSTGDGADVAGLDIEVEYTPL